MDRRVDGILSSYNRILQKINMIDPESKNTALNILKESIYSGIYGYDQMINDLDNYSDEAKNAIKIYKERKEI